MNKNNARHLLAILLTGWLAISVAKAQTFTDPRDGQSYETISFRDALGTTVTWMAQNLNYKMRGSYVYGNNESYHEALGLLYTWEAANNACPNGWHLPTDSEWQMLVNEFGGPDSAGEALKSERGWNNNGNGTNSSGFNALPAGYYNDLDRGFFESGAVSAWWSGSAGCVWNLNSNNSTVGRRDRNHNDGHSVRCFRIN